MSSYAEHKSAVKKSVSRREPAEGKASKRTAHAVSAPAKKRTGTVFLHSTLPSIPVPDGQKPLVFKLGEEVSPSIRHFFVKRGWVECPNDSSDWNVFWRDRAFPRVIHQKLKAHQRLNHHLVPSVISRKDRLAQTMLRMYQAHGSIYDIVPQTFLLPQHWDDFTQFFSQVQSELASSSDSASPASASSSSASSSASSDSASSSVHQCSRNLWIYKPATGRRGQGIFLLEHPSQITEKLQGQPDAAGVVQRYIASPYLIGGFKFDLRVYVLVPTFCPFTAYVHTKGLARFSTFKYDLSSLDNNYSHLTNTSLNKKSQALASNKDIVGSGSKWTFERLFEYMSAAPRNVDTQALWKRIKEMVLLTLLPVVESVPSDRRCWELFGFDVLVDADLRPWVLEVNRSPAMAVTTPADVAVKPHMLTDMFEIIGLDHDHIINSTSSSSSSSSSSASSSSSSSSAPSSSSSAPCSSPSALEQGNIGGFELIFPFNKRVEKAAARLAALHKKHNVAAGVGIGVTSKSSAKAIHRFQSTVIDSLHKRRLRQQQQQSSQSASGDVDEGDEEEKDDHEEWDEEEPEQAHSSLATHTAAAGV